MRLFDDGGWWHAVKRTDARARALADGHYSRQTPGAKEFMGNGRTLVMLTDDGLAVWGVIENLSPGRRRDRRWRVAIFRNSGPVLSSDLIREGTERTRIYWERRYGGRPAVPLQTEVDPKKTRRKRDPGRCFRRAGWRVVGETEKGLIVLEAPS